MPFNMFSQGLYHLNWGRNKVDFKLHVSYVTKSHLNHNSRRNIVNFRSCKICSDACRTKNEQGLRAPVCVWTPSAGCVWDYTKNKQKCFCIAKVQKS